jgi:hypothetical protein
VSCSTGEERRITVDEKEAPRDDGRLNLHDESGMTRRDLMRRGAVVGGTLLWVAPAIQSLSPPAFAQVGTPRNCFTIKYAGSEEGCDDSGFTCITPVVNEADGCAQGVIFVGEQDSGLPWTATLPSNCEFMNGCSKCGDTGCNCDTDQVGQTITFFPCDGQDISHIELEFCCT